MFGVYSNRTLFCLPLVNSGHPQWRQTALGNRLKAPDNRSDEQDGCGGKNEITLHFQQHDPFFNRRLWETSCHSQIEMLKEPKQNGRPEQRTVDSQPPTKPIAPICCTIQRYCKCIPKCSAASLSKEGRLFALFIAIVLSSRVFLCSTRSICLLQFLP